MLRAARFEKNRPGKQGQIHLMWRNNSSRLQPSDAFLVQLEVSRRKKSSQRECRRQEKGLPISEPSTKPDSEIPRVEQASRNRAATKIR